MRKALSLALTLALLVQSAAPALAQPRELSAPRAVPSASLVLGLPTGIPSLAVSPALGIPALPAALAGPVTAAPALAVAVAAPAAAAATTVAPVAALIAASVAVPSASKDTVASNSISAGEAPADPRPALDARFDGSAARSFWAPALAVAVMLPLSSSIHELGHFLAARASGRAATIKVEKVLITDHDSLSYPRQLMISVAGPAFNFLFATGTAAAALAHVLPTPLTPILWLYTGLNIFFGATNLMPFKARGFVGESGVSDGAHARDEWKAWQAARKAKEGFTWKDLADVDKRAQIPAAPATEMAPLQASRQDAEKINDLTAKTLALEPRYAAFTAAQLKNETALLKKKRRSGESLDELLPEAFALGREAMSRTLGKRPYAEQVAAAAALHFGRAVDQKTGEGKTLSIGLAAFLGSLDGPVDVYTFNPYLAVRDADEIGRPLGLLGVTVGALEGRDEAYLFSGDRGRARHASEKTLARVSRAEVYKRADVVYGHTSGFVFDHLFDQDAASRLKQTRRGRAKRFAIVDEVDAAMMEGADDDYRIVSPHAEPAVDYGFLYAVTGHWKVGEDFTLDEKRGEAVLTPKALAFLEALRASDPRFAGWTHLPLYARNALKARHMLTLDRDYAVVMKQAVILDPHTGRLMHGRSWEDGLHRFVEIKEGLTPESDYRLSSHMSLDAYFRLYKKVSGISGTLDGTKDEFQKAYHLPIVGIPPHRPSQRNDHGARLYRTAEKKLNGLIEQALAARKAGRPVLLGAADMAESALLARMLSDRKEAFELLNDMQADEKRIVAAAGKPGAITVATQVAGRGTDIRPTKEALAAGGLLVLLTTMSESRRVDLQYRGRAGRQGEPGETRLFVSLEDELLTLRATDAERALLAASITEDGAPAAGAAADTLKAVQDRVESQSAAGRDLRRRRDESLAPWRETYFARRALLRRLPFPGRSLLLKSLHEGWSEFLMQHEEALLVGSATAESTKLSYRALTTRPSWKALLPWRLFGSAVSGSYRAVEGFFKDSRYGIVWSWLGKHIATPLSVTARILAARGAELVRARPVAIRLYRGALNDAPNRWRSRHRLAALLYARRDYDSAATEFVNLLESLWKPGGTFTTEERAAAAWAMGNLAVSFEARGNAAGAQRRVSRAQDLRLAYELSPTAERKKAADAALKPLTEAEAAAADLTPPFMRIVYLDKARSAVDEGQYKNAEIYFSRVIEMAPTYATAFIGRGYARKQLKDEAGASKDLLESLRLRILASRQFANMRLAYSLTHGSSLSSERVEEAFTELGGDGKGETFPAVVSNSARQSALRNAQAAHAALELDPRQALGYADSAVRYDPRLSAGYDIRGSARFKLGRYRESYQDFADSLLWDLLDHDGAMSRLIAGHTTFINWTPSAGGMAAFVRRLKSL